MPVTGYGKLKKFPIFSVKFAFDISTNGENTMKTTNDYTTGNKPARVYGGISDSLTVSGNTVTLTNGEITNRIYGGYSWQAGNNTENNVVNINGGSGSKNVSGNEVYITGGKIIGYVTGGSADNNGVAFENKVTVSSDVGESSLGVIYGGYSENNAAYRNSVEINGGNIGTSGMSNAWVYGGFSKNGDTYSNKADITGGTVNGLFLAACRKLPGTPIKMKF